MRSDDVRLDHSRQSLQRSLGRVSPAGSAYRYVRAELNVTIAVLRAELNVTIAVFTYRTQRNHNKLVTIAVLRTELNVTIAGLRTELNVTSCVTYIQDST